MISDRTAIFSPPGAVPTLIPGGAPVASRVPITGRGTRITVDG